MFTQIEIQFPKDIKCDSIPILSEKSYIIGTYSTILITFISKNKNNIYSTDNIVNK